METKFTAQIWAKYSEIELLSIICLWPYEVSLRALQQLKGNIPKD